MKVIRRKIKNRENWFYAFLYRIWFTFSYFSIPVPNKWVAAPFLGLYWLHVTLTKWGRWLRKTFYYEPLFRSRCTEAGRQLKLSRLPYFNGIGHLRVGTQVVLSGNISFMFSNELSGVPEIRIGDGTFIGNGSLIYAAERVTIGSHCILAGGTLIYDLDGHPLDPARRRAAAPVERDTIKPVTLEDDVWLGARCIVLKGVTIGARSVVGAGSVVVRDIPPDSIAAGNPAKVIGHVEEKTQPAPAGPVGGDGLGQE